MRRVGYARSRTHEAQQISEEQIIGLLKEQEAGMPTVEVCRRRGVSPASFCNWKSKLGGLEVSEAKRASVAGG